MLVLIYVDDIIITCSSHAAIQSLLRELHNDFAVKDLGPLNYFLGIQVMPCNQGIILSQQRYIMDILKRTKMADAKPISSPMASSTHLSSFEGDLLLEPTLYRSVVGALQYVCITRPDISFCVNSHSLCTNPQNFISSLSNIYFGISSKPFNMGFSFMIPHPLIFRHYLTPTGQEVVMIDDPLGVIAFSLDAT